MQQYIKCWCLERKSVRLYKYLYGNLTNLNKNGEWSCIGKLVQEVLAELPEKFENTLFYFRNGLLRKVPRSRDDFNPQPILSTMDHGSNIMVFDSKICLRTRKTTTSVIFLRRTMPLRESQVWEPPTMQHLMTMKLTREDHQTWVLLLILKQH